MTIRLIQITDLHLLTSDPQSLRGVPTWETFRAVWDRVMREEFELAIFTGDLAHDELPATYDALEQSLNQDIHRCLFIPGNHDLPPQVRSLTANVGNSVSAASDAAVPAVISSTSLLQSPTNSTAAFRLKLGGWNLVGVDSNIPGEVSGRVGNAQLEWLIEVLQDPSPTLVFMHHPPLDIGVGWLDEIGLRNQSEFRELISKHPHVRGIFCGHIHQEFEGRIGETRVLTTPATSMQFSGQAADTRIDLVPPGFRWIELDEDDFKTGVIRLKSLEHPPNLTD